MKINKNYLNLKQSYLFKTIAKKTEEYKNAHPDADIIRMGIGDVTRPLCGAAVAEMKAAAEEMGSEKTFHGYPESFGEDFLIKAVQRHYKKHIGVDVDGSEIVVTCGAKEDVANILDIFDTDNTVLIPDPVYPVYFDTNVMAGRRIKFISANEGNGFLPMPTEDDKADLIYICSPNNPTGSAYTRAQLAEWVDFAKRCGAVILYDAAYEIFVTDKDCPRSIFEVDGARECAIEFCSFSKTAGFTGVRCGYTVVPKDLKCGEVSLHDMWARRHGTKFNGAPYIVQRAGEAVYSEEGKAQLKEQVAYYMKNAKTIKEGLKDAGYTVFGGVNAPYIWLKTPDQMTSWEFFDHLLADANVVGTPGSGFGPSGEGYFRLTAFGTYENTVEAVERIKKL